MASAYGTTLGTFAGGPGAACDLDPQFRLVSGRQAVIESLARRLLTDEGFFPRDPQYGYNLATLQNARLTPRYLASARARIRAQLELDERVSSAEVLTELDARASKLTITMQVESAEGPFSMVMQVADYAASLLKSF